ncbi:MAG: hypothetical protein J6O49_16010 [Bacteroidaceae bacterium]|nr:hypothetical protein [Bacteroidaceae bacterium]
MEELIREIELALISEGQQDTRFQWGEEIRYSPHEVAEILRMHSDELIKLTLGKVVMPNDYNRHI